MRTFVHLLLFVAAIVIAVGVFGPLVGSVDARNVQFDDIRNGFTNGWSLDQIGSHTGAFPTSLAIVLLGVAVVILLAALFGSRLAGWVGVLVGLATLGVLAWRLDDHFDHQLRTDYHHLLLSNTWGLYLVGGGLIVTLLLLLVPRERRRAI